MENENLKINIDANLIVKTMSSIGTYSKLESIGEKYNLMIDQIGQLEIDTRMVMIGKIKSDDFVDTIAKNLEIPRETAQKIAVDINNEILMTVRESIRKMQEGESIVEEKIPSAPPIPPRPIAQMNTERPVPVPNPIQTPNYSRPMSSTPQTTSPYNPPIPPIPKAPPASPIRNTNLSDIERIGGFTIESRPLSNSPQYNDTNPDREEVLKEIEKYENTGSKDGISFVDHLLSNPVSNKEQIKVIKPEVKKDTYTTDPYREPI